MSILENIKKDYQKVSDLVIKDIKSIHVIYLETLVSQDKINEYILKFTNVYRIPKDIKKLIPSPNIKNISSYDELKLFLETGFTIIINKEQIIAIETKGELTRSIETPSTEPTLYGAKDSLNENFQTNLGLIKRRIKSEHLKDETFNIGRFSKTMVNILYIDNIVEKDLVLKVRQKLNNIVIDGINDIGELKQFLHKDDENVFAAFRITERPDVISKSLLIGKIIILMDTSPYALIIPTFLADFINPISDDYTKSINVNFLKILRFFCFFLSLITPAIYISIMTFNQETIPTNLLLNFQNQRTGVPFPSIVECIITLITCEILRESDIRFPSKYGSAISILGGLVLGEAAVSAGIVSPIMIIVVALTFISSMIFTDLEIMNAIRMWRFLFLLAACFYGLYGVGLAFIFFLTNLASYETFGKPYLFPIAPLDKSYIKETLIKMRNKKRSKMLSKNTYKGEA